MNTGLILLAQEAPGGGFMSSILMFGVIIGIFYLLVFRPQIKRQKQHQELLEKLSAGDEIVTSGGLIGKVVQISGPVATIDIGEGGQKTRIRTLKNQIAGRLSDTLQEQQGQAGPAKQ